MKVAVIENDHGCQEQLKQIAGKHQWDIEIFSDSVEFGRADLESYDVIISENDLPSMHGRDLLKSISGKTTAQIFLMGQGGTFADEDAMNDRIKGLIDRSDPDNIEDHLRYVDTKLRIKNLMETEKEKYGNIFPLNGFHLSMDGDTAIIEITELLTDQSKIRLTNNLTERGAKHGLIYFGIKGLISSPYLGILIFIYKFFHSRGGKLAYWDSNQNIPLREQLEMCNLTSLFPVFDTKEGALEYLRI